MTWNDSYKVGIFEVDQQHKQLCDTIDKLFDACSKGEGVSRATEVLHFLIGYTKQHFADEEKMQKLIQYPDFKSHKAMHTDLAKKVAKMEQEMEKEGATVTMVIKINQLISSWLTGHIMAEDTKLKAYMK